MEEDRVVVGNYSPSKHNAANVVDTSGLAPTVMENHGTITAVEEEPKVLGGIGEKKSNGGTQWYQQDRIYADGIAISNTTTAQPYYKTGLRIRKLTPRECMRLMGVKDEDSNKIQQGDSSMYHLAGDSIVTSCLMGLFGELLGIDYKNKIRDLVNDLIEKDQ